MSVISINSYGIRASQKEKDLSPLLYRICGSGFYTTADGALALSTRRQLGIGMFFVLMCLMSFQLLEGNYQQKIRHKLRIENQEGNDSQFIVCN